MGKHADGGTGLIYVGSVLDTLDMQSLRPWVPREGRWQHRMAEPVCRRPRVMVLSFISAIIITCTMITASGSPSNTNRTPTTTVITTPTTHAR